jgi:predicted transcriptional regulator
MNSATQKETLQALINLYQNSENGAVKGKIIAEKLNRNPGTIRNQMSILTTLGYVKGVPGPHGGYKPTIKAYEKLNISDSEKLITVPIFKENEKIENVSTINIDFTSVAHPEACKSAIKILGDIDNINISDEIKVGPTPITDMEFTGTIIGRDDTNNILLLDITGLKSVPKKIITDIKKTKLVKLNPDDSVRNAAKKLYSNEVEESPVLDKNGEIIGIITLQSIIKAFTNEKENGLVKDIMNSSFIKINGKMKLKLAINIIQENNYQPLVVVDDDEKLTGIINSKDILEAMINL